MLKLNEKEISEYRLPHKKVCCPSMKITIENRYIKNTHTLSVIPIK